MADGADLTFDLDKLASDGDRLVRGYLTAGVTAISNVTRRLEQRLEQATSAAGGGRLARAWASEVFPRRIGPARNPVGTVFINGGARSRGAMTFFAETGSARQKDGFFFAVPLPAAGARGRDRNLTPGEWERAHPGMRLQFVYRGGNRPSLLVAVGTLNGRTGRFRAPTAKRQLTGRGLATVPIFLLIPEIRFRGSVGVKTYVQQAQMELPGEFAAAARSI